MSSPSPESLTVLNKIQIHDNHEPLVDVRDFSGILHVREGVIPLVRKTVAEKLVVVAADLPGQYQLSIRRGYRSLAHQQKNWEAYRDELAALHPTWPLHILHREVNRFHAPYNQPCPPGHSTGGAVDVYLLGSQGEFLDLVTPLEDWSLAATNSTKVSKEQQAVRQLLCASMEHHGFSNFERSSLV
jgi:D-alanyl-D-alanine dipeptidase